jgi:phenylalanyl-tRNA synthetase beta chain
VTVVRTPYSWLKELLPELESAPAEVARLLTLNGIESEVSSERAEAWSHIWVARVEALEKHPRADKLLLASVDYGHGRATVVTGATNLKPGDVVPFAEVGARLIDSKTGKVAPLKPEAFHGVRSAGMVCSALELGLGEDHEGILVLDPKAPIGAPLAHLLGAPALQSELRPNRPDCLGVLGLAREIAALLDLEVREPAADPLPTSAPGDFSVTIEDPERCPRYSAAFLSGVRVGPSPAWLAERLVAAGMRPINNVVDITNYVMLETGQPLHAFDRRRLRGAAIRVRRARSGERLVTLDGIERILDPGVLVIADAEVPVALAGIVGGADSEIAEDTSEVVLEVAKFENRAIWRTAAALRVQTESGKRFAWDITPELVPVAQRRALRLLRELAGSVQAGFVDRYPARRKIPNIRVPFARMTKLLGVELPRDEVLDALRRLGCRYALDGETLVVSPPWWRTDVTIAEDVIEEAARLVGYERIPTRLPAGPLPLHEPHPLEGLREQVRDVLVGAGLQEIVSYPLVDPAWLEMLSPSGERVGPEPIRVTNPLSAELSVLRTTLLPSLLETARRNLRWSGGVGLFEIGKRYLPRPKDLPEERWSVGLLLSGRRPENTPRDWLSGEARALDYYDVSGILEGLANALHLALPELEPGAPQLHPGRSAWARVGERELIRLGELDPRVAERWELPSATVVAELDLALLAERRAPLIATLPSRFPSAFRELAIEIDEGTTWRQVRDEVRSAGGKRVAQLSLLDVYRGPQVGAGKKSFAIRLAFQSDEGTLAEEEIERLHRRITARLQRAFGATLRD